MGFPQVTSRLISAPVQALRAVFEGIGRVVTAADRPEGPAASGSRDTAAAGADSRPGAPASPAQRTKSGTKSSRRAAPPPPAPRWRSLDETGNVRLLTAEDMGDGDSKPNPAAAAETAAPETGSPEISNGTSSDLPLPGYDTLTLPSIRARLRGLDTAQLRTLVAYESAHAERPEVLGMFERRIEKLEAGG